MPSSHTAESIQVSLQMVVAFVKLKSTIYIIPQDSGTNVKKLFCLFDCNSLKPYAHLLDLTTLNMFNLKNAFLTAETVMKSVKISRRFLAKPIRPTGSS